MIWYTGHGVEDSGDWVFCDGTISFRDIYDLYQKYFRGKLLYIVVDCCYSGQWVQCLAEYLISQRIGACGHCSREKDILIKVMAACLPHESAYDGAFSKKGVCTGDQHYRRCMYFRQSKIFKIQTPCSLDSTEICCYKKDKCMWSSIPKDTSWNWSQLADRWQRMRINNRMFRVCVGKHKYWHVLVKSCNLKNFEEKKRKHRKKKRKGRKVFPKKDLKGFGCILDKGCAKHSTIKKFSPTVHKSLI